jgi:hypothetical protein
MNYRYSKIFRCATCGAVGKMCFQDYARLNEAPARAKLAIKDAEALNDKI